jgi:hypothetical protein
MLPDLFTQIAIMHPFIDTNSSNFILPKLSSDDLYRFTVSKCAISMNPQIDHISKSPKNHIDIFSDYIQPTYGDKWLCETWIRGHACVNDENVRNNTSITVGNATYSSSHDHSKYACNYADIVYIGDLNRMTSQFHRGGGGIVIKDIDLAKAFQSIMNTI